MLDANGKKGELISDLQRFYPRLKTLPQTKPGPGWFGFAAGEDYAGVVETDMKHVNDGFPRILAILAQRFSSKSILLFDEIENGINQELIGKLVDVLLNRFADKQILITTHSPLVLNYLSDESVRNGVVMMYRDGQGHACGCKFFDIPEVLNKLSYLNAGQVMADMNLIELAARLPLSENA